MRGIARGFTLIELMIVVAIIAILAAIACLCAAITSGRLPTATITKIDGFDALAAPIAPQLSAAGFRQTPRGLRLRSGTR